MSRGPAGRRASVLGRSASVAHEGAQSTGRSTAATRKLRARWRHRNESPGHVRRQTARAAAAAGHRAAGGRTGAGARRPEERPGCGLAAAREPRGRGRERRRAGSSADVRERPLRPGTGPRPARVREEATRRGAIRGRMCGNSPRGARRLGRLRPAPVRTNQSGKARDRRSTQAAARRTLHVIATGSVVTQNRPRVDEVARTGAEWMKR